MIRIQTTGATVEISIPEISEYTGQPLTNVGIKISGGADSALLAYMLATYKRDYRPDITLHAITCNSAKKPYQAIYAQRVVKKVSELTGVRFENHFIHEISGTKYPEEQEEFLLSIYDSKIIDCHFMGETINPPEHIAELQTYDRPRGRDMEAPTRVRHAFRPFRMLHKKNIAELYAHYGITDDLFPITRSCEHITTDAQQLSVHCGECWFCLERRWGFGRLV